MTKRRTRRAMAQETVALLAEGGYRPPQGHYVDLSAAIQACIDGTRCYDPERLVELREAVLAREPEFPQSSLELANESTLEGSARLATSGACQRVAALNFASARNPGGGFLNGAQAQEESLARSSALYVSLQQCPSYYSSHRTHNSLLYSDRMIFTPHCPVFRKDDGSLLEQPYLIDFITSPAPNAGAVANSQPEKMAYIEETLRERSSKLLALAIHHGCDGIVLGAWGCGVFRNDPGMVADIFHEQLGPGGPFEGRFKKVLFSVLDFSADQQIFGAFQKRFGQRGL